MMLEAEATRGVTDYGWHWPRWMVQRAWQMLRAYHVFLTPEQVISIPETWFHDLEQMENLYQFHVIDTEKIQEQADGEK